MQKPTTDTLQPVTDKPRRSDKSVPPEQNKSYRPTEDAAIRHVLGYSPDEYAEIKPRKPRRKGSRHD